MPMDIEIRHARVVAALAEAGSVSKAAAVLALPQPSLTAKLQRIERTLGGALFVRSRTGLSPTAFGERVIPLMVDLVNRADALLCTAGTGDRRELRIASPDWTSVSFHTALRDAFPTHPVTTTTMDQPDSVDAVRAGALTAALCYEPAGRVVGDPALTRTVVTREPVWLLAPPDHAVAHRDTVALSELRTSRWVRRVPSTWAGEVEDMVFGVAGEAAPRAAHHVHSHAEALAWVRDAGALALASPVLPSAGARLVPITGSLWLQVCLLTRPAALSEHELGVLLGTVRAHHVATARTSATYWTWLLGHADLYPELTGLLVGRDHPVRDRDQRCSGTRYPSASNPPSTPSGAQPRAR